MKVHLYEIEALTDDLEITQSVGTPHILKLKWEIAGVQFLGQASIDIEGVYSVTVLNPRELFKILQERRQDTFGEQLDIEVKI